MKWKNKINSGKKYNNGDILTAESLNALIDETGAVSELTRGIFGADLVDAFNQGFDTEWVKEENVLKEKDFILKYGKTPFWAKVFVADNVDDLIDIIDLSNNEGLGFKIKELQALNNEEGQSLALNYKIVFYFDESRTKVIAEKEAVLLYHTSPGGSND